MSVRDLTVKACEASHILPSRYEVDTRATSFVKYRDFPSDLLVLLRNPFGTRSPSTDSYIEILAESSYVFVSNRFLREYTWGTEVPPFFSSSDTVPADEFAMGFLQDIDFLNIRDRVPSYEKYDFIRSPAGCITHNSGRIGHIQSRGWRR